MPMPPPAGSSKRQTGDGRMFKFDGWSSFRTVRLAGACRLAPRWQGLAEACRGSSSSCIRCCMPCARPQPSHCITGQPPAVSSHCTTAQPSAIALHHCSAVPAPMAWLVWRPSCRSSSRRAWRTSGATPRRCRSLPRCVMSRAVPRRLDGSTWSMLRGMTLHWDPHRLAPSSAHCLSMYIWMAAPGARCAGAARPHDLAMGPAPMCTTISSPPVRVSLQGFALAERLYRKEVARGAVEPMPGIPTTGVHFLCSCHGCCNVVDAQAEGAALFAVRPGCSGRSCQAAQGMGLHLPCASSIPARRLPVTPAPNSSAQQARCGSSRRQPTWQPQQLRRRQCQPAHCPPPPSTPAGTWRRGTRRRQQPRGVRMQGQTLPPCPVLQRLPQRPVRGSLCRSWLAGTV